ncbi:MAG: ATP-binding protein [Candidatus Poribacteria bacterium]|nr:ATP-binding protein [Candidatus Poribacteria bacterium]
MRRYSIQTKIVLPFLLLFAVVAVVLSLVSIEIFAWKYNEQFTRETEGWLNTIMETGYFEQDPEKIKSAYSVEIMIFGSDYTLNVTTLAELSNVEQDWTHLADKMRLREVKPYLENPDGTSVIRDITLDGKPYKVFYLPLKVGRFYCLLRPMEAIAEAKRTLTWYMLGIAVLVTGLVALISHLIGRNLTNPIKVLVDSTARVATGNLDEQCELKTHDEIGDLAAAFNQMTRDLKQSSDQLIQAERLATAGKMSASFAHEIRNPLSSMRMLAQMLMQKPEMSEEQHQQSLRYILEEIERIDTIVKGLMDFSGPTALNLTQQPLPPVLKAVLDLMEANLAHHKIQLELDLLPETPEIQFDSDKLKQAFMNVVLNAMEAMPQGGTLKVSTIVDEDRVGIKIVDTGIGIPEEDLGQLFEPFFTKKTRGTGLGLANVKRILEEHGGNVEIESALSEGTEVSLWLPLSVVSH